MEYLLKNTTDKKERAYLLNHYLDSFKGTVYRQTQFAEYEMLTNKMYEDGESLTADNLSSVYLELNKKYLMNRLHMNGQESHIFITTSMFISMRQAIVQHFLWRIRFWKRELRQ